MIAHMLDKTVNIGTILCHSEAKDKLCDELRSEGVAYYPARQIEKAHEQVIVCAVLTCFKTGDVFFTDQPSLRSA
jgi:hypothetical protein